MRSVSTPTPIYPAPLLEAFGEAQWGLAELDLQGRVLSVNKQFVELLGLPKRSIVGAKFPQLIVTDERERLERIVRRVAAGGTAAGGEIRLLFGDGTRRWLSHRVLAVRNAAGTTERLLLLLQDETLKRQRRSELQTARTQLEGLVQTRTSDLEATVRELEAFNYSITHDLRTPLRSVRGFAGLLLAEKEHLPKKLQTQVEFIHAAAGRMSDTIEGLLRLARMSRGELRRDRVDVSAMAEKILAELARNQPTRKADIHIEPGLVAQADAQMVEVLLQNLLHNAWKFSRSKPKARIEVGRAVVQERNFFFIQDNGVGFDSKLAGDLFQPFRRLHGEREFEGTGLGLATARRVVRRHGGQIFAEATPGQGATFYFSLSRWAEWG